MSFWKNVFGGDEDDFNENEPVSVDGRKEPESFSQAPSSSQKPSRTDFLLVKPATRDELKDIAASLMEGKTIVLNLELVSKDARRFVDFLTGVAFALKGQVRKIASETYLIIPGGMNISGDIFDDFEDDVY